MVSEKVLEELRKGKKSGLNLSFAGCGFLGIYHIGVASCLRENAPHLIADKVSGASAGGLVACAMITNCCLGECTSYTLNLAMRARRRALGPLHPSFNLVGYLQEALKVFLPPDAYRMATGRLHLSLTRVSDRRNVLVSQYDNNDDLIQALICSAFVPFYCGLIPPKYKGVRYVDGGLSDNIPILDDNTISVSPFAGESDVCPNDGSASFLHLHLAGTSIQCNTGNLFRFSHAFFPPEPEVLRQMCERGYDDALKFLQINNLISCPEHLDDIGLPDIPDLAVAETISELSSSVSESDLLSLLDPEEMEEIHRLHGGQPRGTHGEEGVCTSCAECEHHLNIALGTKLPSSVTNALETAIHSVNGGVLNTVYKFRLYKVLSLMAAPYLLPWEYAAILIKKFVTWAPYMPTDLQWFAKELVYVVKTILQIVQNGRHRYSARFTCQLALTDLETKEEFNAVRLSNMMKSLCVHEQQHTNTQRQFGISFAYNAPKSDHVIDMEGETPAGVTPGSSHHALHMGELPSGIPTRCPHLPPSYPGDWPETDRPYPGGGERPYPGDRSRRPSNASLAFPDVDPVNNVYDSFEHSLQIANQMESILSVYYGTESDVVTVQMAS